MRNYVIAMTNRTGSSWLCHLLTAAGAGEPWEYLHLESGSPMQQRVQELKARDSVGIKCSIGQWRRFAPLFGEEWIRQARFIHLRRRSLWHQAVSQYRAEWKGVWHLQAQQAMPDPDIMPPFNAERICQIRDSFFQQHLDWNAWFTNSGIRPLDIRYEDLYERTEAVVRSVLKEIELDNAIYCPIQQTRVMRDQTTEQWVKRLRGGQIFPEK